MILLAILHNFTDVSGPYIVYFRKHIKSYIKFSFPKTFFFYYNKATRISKFELLICKDMASVRKLHYSYFFKL